MIIFLKILSICLGLAFFIFGYLIYFCKKFNLINGFKDDFKKGKRTTQYALRVGLIELIIGSALFLVGLFLIFL